MFFSGRRCGAVLERPTTPANVNAIVAVQLRAAALAGVDVAVLLRPGALLGARVLERHGDHGLLMLAGAPVVAELPEHVAEGAQLRLRVSDVSGERVTLQLQPDAAPPAAAIALTLP